MTITEEKAKYKGKLEKIEKEIFETACREAQKMAREYLDKIDIELMTNRKHSVYRHKGLKETTWKTKFGEVTYSRRLYEVRCDDGEKCFIFLLDAVLGLGEIGQISNLLAKDIVQAACSGSYREVAAGISRTTGITISPQTAWSVTQQVGEAARAHEDSQAARAKANAGGGQNETAVLFLERDGIHIPLQRADRKEHGKSKELKIGIAYDGIKVNGRRRRLSNKVAVAGFMEIGAFNAKYKGVIAAKYNVDEVKAWVLNGDGASWIKNLNYDDLYYQLDRYHVNKALIKAVGDPAERRAIFNCIKKGDTDGAVEQVKQLRDSTGETPDKGLSDLYTYFDNNREGLVPIKQYEDKLPGVNEGLVFAHGGAMESNVFTLAGNRMKDRRACWSIKGASNLASLLCLKYTDQMGDVLPLLVAGRVPEIYQVHNETPLTLSAAKVPETVGKGYNGFTHASIPDMEWAKGLLGMQPLFGGAL